MNILLRTVHIHEGVQQHGPMLMLKKLYMTCALHTARELWITHRVLVISVLFWARDFWANRSRWEVLYPWHLCAVLLQFELEVTEELLWQFDGKVSSSWEPELPLLLCYSPSTALCFPFLSGLCDSLFQMIWHVRKTLLSHSDIVNSSSLLSVGH